DDIAGDANHEQVAEPLVEDDLRLHPRVGAAEDDGERLLRRAEPAGVGVARGAAAMAHVGDEAAVAGLKAFEGSWRGDHRSLFCAGEATAIARFNRDCNATRDQSFSALRVSPDCGRMCRAEDDPV